ncbi:MAG TPA: universal stress protein [Streptosporangiaceae bacterium]|nr:universal stress protein [Streptosporangiaceae bacterium]
MTRRSQASGMVSSSTSPGGQPRGAQRPEQRPAGRRVAVIVDGTPGSAPALRQAASQARQRNAVLEVIRLLPAGADAREVTLARVRLSEFTRRACPYGVGAPVRLRVEHGDLAALLPAFQADAELLITASAPDAGTGHDVTGPREPPQGGAPQARAAKTRAPRTRLGRRGSWLRAVRHAPG